MISRPISRTGLTAALVGAAALFLAGCAAKTAIVEGTSSAGIILLYKMPVGQVLKYHEVGEVKESGEVMGQTIERRTGKKVIVEDFSPLIEGAVASNDQGTMLIAFSNNFI